MVTKTVKSFPTVVGMESCVGCLNTHRPVEFGNYCELYHGPYLVNMWSENVRAARDILGLKEIEVTVFSDGKHHLGVVTDKRLPNGYIYDGLCVTGRGWGSRELCEAIGEFTKVDISNCVCGCEKPDESPLISRFGSFRDGMNNICSRCSRKWKCERKSKL
jgi:hypothetical protein